MFNHNDYAWNNALTKITKHLLRYRQPSAHLEVFYFLKKLMVIFYQSLSLKASSISISISKYCKISSTVIAMASRATVSISLSCS